LRLPAQTPFHILLSHLAQQVTRQAVHAYTLIEAACFESLATTLTKGMHLCLAALQILLFGMRSGVATFGKSISSFTALSEAYFSSKTDLFAIWVSNCCATANTRQRAKRVARRGALQLASTQRRGCHSAQAASAAVNI
jgi:hypothetical protein